MLIFTSASDRDWFDNEFGGVDLSRDGITVKGGHLKTGRARKEHESHNADDNRSYRRREHELSSRPRDESRGSQRRDDRREDRHDGVREPHPRPRDESFESHDQRSSSSWGGTHQPTMQPTPIAPPYVQPLPIPARPPNQRVARGLACGAQG